jgi:hypothetical protein
MARPLSEAARERSLLQPAELIPLREAIAAHVPARLGKSTPRRWAIWGIAGVRLPCVRIGKRLYSTSRAVQWFLDEIQQGLPTESPYLGPLFEEDLNMSSDEPIPVGQEQTEAGDTGQPQAATPREPPGARRQQ